MQVRTAPIAPPARSAHSSSRPPRSPTFSSKPRLPSEPWAQPKVAREGPTPVPSETYLAATRLPVFAVHPSVLDPPLLILDLNNTLLVREARTFEGSRRPVVRDYLSTFLQYLCGREVGDEQGQEVGRRWKAVVYSSARLGNVSGMCRAIGLIPATRSSSPAATPIGFGHPLLLLWSRERMGLTPAEFVGNVETVKDLESVWQALEQGRWGPERSILLDDEAGKAVRAKILRRARLTKLLSRRCSRTTIFQSLRSVSRTHSCRPCHRSTTREIRVRGRRRQRRAHPRPSLLLRRKGRTWRCSLRLPSSSGYVE